MEIKVNGSWIREHRYVAEQRLGRKLLPYEIVHHKDGKKDNNKPENLEVMTHAEHTILHSTGRIVSQETRDKQSAARKGRPAHNKGVPMSESQKLKIRDAKKDPSQEVREKISKASKIAWEKRRESGSAKQSPEHIAKRIAARLATLERKRKEKEAAQGDLYFEP